MCYCIVFYYSSSAQYGKCCVSSVSSISLVLQIKRSQIRKGMMMLSPRLEPTACWEFEGEILVLHHPTTISVKYQAMGTHNFIVVWLSMFHQSPTYISSDILHTCLVWLFNIHKFLHFNYASFYSIQNCHILSCCVCAHVCVSFFLHQYMY